MKNTAVRALRTYLHTLIGLWIASPLADLDLGAWKTMLVAAAPAALSVIQNGLEQSGVGLGPRG